jgi:hypothetical protein
VGQVSNLPLQFGFHRDKKSDFFSGWVVISQVPEAWRSTAANEGN